MNSQKVRHQRIWCPPITNPMIFLVWAAVLVLHVAELSWAAPAIVAKPVITGLSNPIAITNAGDESGRLFIVLQNGQIIINDGIRVLSPPFLDIASLVSSGGERGLLSVAFHPNYATNGFFFVNYTNIRGDTVIARYSVSANPNIADSNSAVILFTITQPFSNHNGGQLQFGPDGYLYIGMGDGGSGGDPQNNAQNLTTLLGKMLRIDIDNGFPYAIPPDNPFRGDPGARDEIWSLGLRNPWRFGFDRSTGDLLIADVGQSSWEEVNFQLAGSSGGENYGWRLMEGNHCFNPPSGCDNGNLTLPILEYDHSVGCSITGGYRYRGTENQGLEGIYVYGDFCTGRIWGAIEDGSGGWTISELLDTSFLISAFGEDENGEIYFAHRSSSSGAIYQIVEVNNDEAEIIGTWDIGIWYWDVAAAKWTRMTSSPPDGDIAAGDFTGDGKADVASIWTSGLWYQDGDTLNWTKVSGTDPVSLTAGDVNGDDRSEIIVSWSGGISYWDLATSTWTKMTASIPTGDIAAGDFTDDGRADVASIWPNGLWYQDSATLGWTKVGTAPINLTAGDLTGDGRAEIIGTWSSGIWYWDVAAAEWTQMTSSTPTGEIAAGDFTGDGKADVASCWGNGLWYQDGDTLDWTKVSNTAPTQVAAGDVTGD